MSSGVTACRVSDEFKTEHNSDRWHVYRNSADYLTIDLMIQAEIVELTEADLVAMLQEIRNPRMR